MISVIGYDGSPIGERAARALAGATLVVGGRRQLDAVEPPPHARRVVLGDGGGGLEAALDEVAAHPGDAAVVASGDPGYFGIVRALHARGLGPLEVVPAVSSVALAFARAGLPWDDAVVVSAHGRALAPALHVCLAAPKVAILTAPGAGPAELGAGLAGSGRLLVVACWLGTPDEQIVRCSPEQAAGRRWAAPNVTLVLDTDRLVGDRGWVAGVPAGPDGWALADEAFSHRDSMISKAEVRALALARLGPRPGALIWDVGAGSGAVAVECARFGAAVVAIEQDERACRRIAGNAAAHAVYVRVVAGRAPQVLEGLPAADGVFVGGGGPEVVAGAVRYGAPRRLVVALAAVDRVPPVRATLACAGYAVGGVQLSASRLVPLPDGASRLAAVNPVFVMWGERG